MQSCTSHTSNKTHQRLRRLHRTPPVLRCLSNEFAPQPLFALCAHSCLFSFFIRIFFPHVCCNTACCRYDCVTLLFSGIVGFAKYCAANTDAEGAMKIVKMLNELYTIFDALCDTKRIPNIYKVSTDNTIWFSSFVRCVRVRVCSEHTLQRSCVVFLFSYIFVFFLIALKAATTNFDGWNAPRDTTLCWARVFPFFYFFIFISLPIFFPRCGKRSYIWLYCCKFTTMYEVT